MTVPPQRPCDLMPAPPQRPCSPIRAATVRERWKLNRSIVGFHSKLFLLFSCRFSSHAIQPPLRSPYSSGNSAKSLLIRILEPELLQLNWSIPAPLPPAEDRAPGVRERTKRLDSKRSFHAKTCCTGDLPPSFGFTARADQFNFTYVGSNSSATGYLVANPNGDGSFTAISGAGIYTNPLIGQRNINLVVNPHAPAGTADAKYPGGVVFTYDDQLFPRAARSWET